MSDPTVVAVPVPPTSKLAQVSDVARRTSWRFVGALVMESKNGVQAISLQRLLTLATYAVCLWFWLRPVAALPDTLLYTLWGMLGISGATKVVGQVRGSNDGDSVGA